MNRLAAICAGQNSAWPIMLACLSNITHEKSRPSLKIGEKAVRIMVMPISRQMFTMLLLMTARVTGSIMRV